MTTAPASAPIPGLTTLPSQHSVAETIARLESLARAKGLTIFAKIDFAADAASVGLIMPPAQLLLFGNPIAGTPAMLAAPTLAIDLPLKALAWQNAAGQSFLSFNTPAYLQSRHQFPAAFTANFAALETLIRTAAS